MKISQNAKNAIFIGTLCSVSYLAVYFARNILGAAQPQMLESGKFNEQYFGTLSSIYFISYAIGQLVNGAIGDKIKARYMISLGLLFAGVTNLVFSFVAMNALLANVVYAMTGFFLAMIYGPMTKVVAENTEPVYATRCSLGYTFASFFGSPLAGWTAAILAWQTVFAVSSVALMVMAVACFTCFLIFEKKGLIQYNKYDRVKKERGIDDFKETLHVLYKHQIVKFSFVSILTGVVRTAVVFWLPTYINQYLSFEASTASKIYTVATLFISTTTFITVFVYELFLKRDMNKTVLWMFSLSTCFFALVYFVKTPFLNVAFMVLAIMSCNGAATMLWSKYCPSLRDTGVVSGATGFLDFLSYVAAAVASSVFANAVGTIGWGNLILVWLGLMACGVVVAFPYKRHDCHSAQ
jgi:sugar phosphate permease